MDVNIFKYILYERGISVKQNSFCFDGYTVYLYPKRILIKHPNDLSTYISLDNKFKITWYEGFYVNHKILASILPTEMELKSAIRNKKIKELQKILK